MLLGLLCLALFGIFYGLRRANELFVLSARAGTLTVSRGRLPPALFADLVDIAAREQLDNVRIRAVSESGVPRLICRGPMHAAAEQAARNVLGRFTVSQLRAGRRRA
jgi:hypothetical protein